MPTMLLQSAHSAICPKIFQEISDTNNRGWTVQPCSKQEEEEEWQKSMELEAATMKWVQNWEICGQECEKEIFHCCILPHNQLRQGPSGAQFWHCVCATPWSVKQSWGSTLRITVWRATAGVGLTNAFQYPAGCTPLFLMEHCPASSFMLGITAS